MPEEYNSLVTALKALEQDGTVLPMAEDEWYTRPDTMAEDEWYTRPDTMAEDEWYTRPDTVSYGIVSLDFESNQLNADDAKGERAHEGSVDLFSLARNGAGWVPLITGTLETYCGPCWSLNSHTYERETGLFHWEWVFEV